MNTAEVVPIEQARQPKEQRPPAHDLDAEAAVLSAVLINPERLADVRAVLEPGDFYADANKRIYEALTELADADRAIDVVQVASWLREAGRLEQVGGSPYIAQIIDATPAVANVTEHATIVREHADRRRIIAEARTAAALAESGTDLAEVAAALRDGVQRIGCRGDMEAVRGSDIFAPLPPVNWLIEPLDICPGPPTLIAGYGYSAKTLSSQAAAVAIVGGSRVWGAFAARQGRVIHCDYEQGQRLTVERYQRLLRGADMTPDDVADRLAVIAMPTVYLDSPGAEDIFARVVAGYDMAIFDSLRAAAPSLEENASEMRRVLDMLTRVAERTGCCPLVIHHARKPSQDKAGGARVAIRGSGAIFDACASVLVYEGEKDQPVRVSHEKARTSGHTTDDFTLTVEDADIDDDPRGGLIVTAEAAAEARGADLAAEHDERVLEIIQANPGANVRTIRGLARPLRNTDIDDSIGRLIAAKKVTQKPAARGALLHYATTVPRQ